MRLRRNKLFSLSRNTVSSRILHKATVSKKPLLLLHTAPKKNQGTFFRYRPICSQPTQDSGTEQNEDQGLSVE